MHALPRLSLRNRSFIALVCLVVSVLGVFAMVTLKQQLIPSVTLPAVSVTVVSPGATAEQIANQIADPIERSVRTIENVESTSATSRSSLSTVTVNLAFGSDLARATSQIDNSINSLKDSFPQGTTITVRSGGSGSIPAMIIAVASDHSPEELNSRLTTTVVPELEKVAGVASVQVLGAPQAIIRLELDQPKMTERRITENDITSALGSSGKVLPGGQVTEGGNTLDVTVGQPFDNIDQIADVRIIPAAGGAPVRLGDIAKVQQSIAAATSVSRTNGRDSVVMMVTPTTDGNLVDISKQVTQRLQGLTADLGGNSEFTPVFDQAPFIQESIAGLATEGALGLAFAVLVILVFLLAVRPTIISAISIPLSMLMAFVGMLATNTTLNMLSLAGLTITIGRMVDDSIVVIENITRHLGYGRTKGRAIMDATGEVAGAVTSSTLVAMLVFAPLLLVSGTAGELFRPFALTVVMALAASWIVSLTIVPVLAYWFAKPHVYRRRAGEEDLSPVELAHAHEERSPLTRAYAGPLAWALRHRWVTLLLALLIFAGSIAFIPLLKTSLLGDSGQNTISVTQKLAPGTSLAESTRQAERTEADLMKVSGVQTVQTTVGGGRFGQGAGAEEISYSLTTEIGNRHAEIRAAVQQLVQQRNADGDAGELAVSDQASLTGSGTVDVKLTAPDDRTLGEANDRILAAVRDLPGVRKVESDFTAAQPSVQVTVDREKAAAMGLTEERAVGLIAAKTADRSITRITLQGRELEVYLSSSTKAQTVEDVRNLDLGGFKIDRIATVSEVRVAPTVATENAVRTVTIAVTPESSDNLGAVSTAVTDAVHATQLPDGATTSMGGASAELTDSFGQLGLAILAAVLLIYVVLVWIFKSLTQPLILLVSIPLATTGSIAALLITDTPLGLAALIGLLMLTGIVVTNAIVLIDLVNQYRREGMSTHDALTRGGHHRVRPILMTALATIFALLPSALGLSGQSSFISGPLAIVTIGGLLTSTFMTLLVVPVLYSLIEGRRQLPGTEEWEHDEPAPGAAAPNEPADGGPNGVAPKRALPADEPAQLH
ncbi:efflux RND transporter permease subunit [Granulicoccus phenolivorans]|uniref:efflux RND transporter permease subunit n=1 Tax=Granulicoccus phenolivorans TaxID=266854 RepID=UPI0003F99367|nr:efflux RND transporter permease subunit [Granulicoccus phenolivorans]